MTTEIRFYHLQRQSVAQALPALLDKALSTGKRIMLRVPDNTQAQIMSDALWSGDKTSFIPHGNQKDGNESLQPIWISSDNDNLNEAMILVSINEAPLFDEESFDLCCYVFDGHNDQIVQQARSLWKSYKDSEYDLTYWQQGERGWEKKA